MRYRSNKKNPQRSNPSECEAMTRTKSTIGKFIKLSDEPGCEKGFYIPILTRIMRLIAYQRRSHPNTFIAVLNIEFPPWSRHWQTDNNKLQKSVDTVIRSIKNEVKKENPQVALDISLLWKLERDGTLFYYRLIFSCNADAFSSTERLTELLDYHWCRKFVDIYHHEIARYVTYSLLDDKDTIITQSNHSQLKPVFKWLSHVARIDGTDGVKHIFKSSKNLLPKYQSEQINDY